MQKDYYSILKVDRNAPQEVIHAAYRTLMGKMGKHPDLGGNEEEAKEINTAYEVLKDPRLRADYDMSIKNGSSDVVKSGPERRRAERRQSKAPISFCLKHDYKWYSAVLEDISELGVKFKSHEPLTKGQEITIAWANHTCEAVRGVIRWSRMYHPNLFERIYEVGVEFDVAVKDIDNRVAI